MNKLPPHTMDSIKKKMHAMKQTYENACDRANQAEQKTKDLEDKLKKVNNHYYRKKNYTNQLVD